MNAIELLKKDHQKVAGLFKQYESAGEDASSKKEELFRRIKRELDIHARIEEEIFYPAAKQVPVEEARELVAEAAEEHKQVKTLLAELAGMDAEDERFDAKMKVLKEDVEHHVEEEENEMFPKVKKGLGGDRLEDLGRRLEYRRQSLAAAGIVEDEDDEDESDEATEEAGAGWQAGSRTLGSGSSSGSQGGSSMASRGGSSSDTRDDAIVGAMGDSKSESVGGSKSGSMGGSGSASRSRSGSRGSSRGASRTGSRSRAKSGSRSRSSVGSRSRSGSRSRASVGSRSRSRSGGSRGSRGRSR